MAVSAVRPTFEDPVLQAEIKQLRQVDNHTNLLYLAVEYLCLIAVIGGTVVFAEYRAAWGLAWAWNIPVFATAMILIGGLQHRLAGLGHESSHYSFMRNRYLNDLIPDVFCMFPLMTTIHFYRLFHLGHHQFTNDPERDPDLLNLGHGKRAKDFPMSRMSVHHAGLFRVRRRAAAVSQLPVGLHEGEHAGPGPERVHGQGHREVEGIVGTDPARDAYSASRISPG